jgi:hypothetical protein
MCAAFKSSARGAKVKHQKEVFPSDALKIVVCSVIVGVMWQRSKTEGVVT